MLSNGTGPLAQYLLVLGAEPLIQLGNSAEHYYQCCVVLYLWAAPTNIGLVILGLRPNITVRNNGLRPLLLSPVNICGANINLLVMGRKAPHNSVQYFCPVLFR